ncbi:MAG: STAS domain-containing protein [Deltaproteobacteria bacterium]|nr:STAS domain-containing protein [Deltaproteobacteria bacterium]
MLEYEEKTITVADDSQYRFISVSGLLGIEHIVIFKELLLNAFGEFDHIVMDWARVTAVDFSVLQLMCSTNEYAQCHGKQFELKNRFIPPVIDTAQRLGFLRDNGCSHVTDPSRCLWVAGCRA